jgi:hypothetical protein
MWGLAERRGPGEPDCASEEKRPEAPGS